MMRFRLLVGCVLVLALSACAGYAPKPLPRTPNGAVSVSALSTNPAWEPRWAQHRFDPSDGLDSEELAMLAVANNPQLRAARAAAGVSQAQVFSAGLLADPQLGFNEDFSLTPGALNAWAVGLGFDVGDWLLRSSRKHMAAAQRDQVDQQLLWQEWQVVAHARLLFVRLQAQDELLKIWSDERDVLAARYRASQAALTERNVTAEVTSADWLAWQAVERQINELMRSRRQNQADLDVLLGLADSVPVSLSGNFSPEPLDAPALRAQWTQRLDRRPDMVALRAGYQAQEASYRATVLAQFPVLALGVSRAQDNFGDNSAGLGLTMSVPIFNRNRGNIAVARATRRQLYDEYQARLNAAYSEIAVALDNLTVLQSLLTRDRQGLPALQAQAAGAEAAYRAGNLSGVDYARFQTAWLDKRAEMIGLDAAFSEQQITLLTLLGPDLPVRGQP